MRDQMSLGRLLLAAFLLLLHRGFFVLLGLFLFGQNLLHALLFFDQEGAHDALAHGLDGQATAIGAGHGALTLLQALHLDRTTALDTVDELTSVTTFDALGSLLDVQVHQLATWDELE